MQPSSQPDPFWRKPAILGAALFLIAAGVFFPAMTGDFIWDDDITLTNNPLVKLPFDEGLKFIWFSKYSTDYYPVTWSSFWLEWRLFESNAKGYHIVNILLHALSSLLLWRILLRLKLPGGPMTAWCAALLFAIHPICVDSVAWISQRKNTLSMVFYLAAILSYLRFDDGKGKQWYWTALAAFLTALLSKSSIITLPLVLVCLLWFRHGTPFVRKLVFMERLSAFRYPFVRLLPFFILAAAAAFMTLWFQGKVLGYGLDSGDDAAATIAGAIEGSFTGARNERNFGDRVLASGQVYWFYVAKILFPAGVAMVYHNWKVNPWHFSHYLPTLLMIAAIVASFLLSKKIGRGLCAGLAYVAVALLPVLGFVAMSYQNYSWVANHLAYIAVPGVVTLAAGLAAHLFSRLGSASRILAPATVALVAIVFAVQSWNRCGFYQDPEQLWRDNIAKQPNAHGPWNELGIVLIHKSDQPENAAARTALLEQAADAFRKCATLDPTFVKPHNNLGTVLAYLKRYEESAEAFKRALSFNEHDPDALGNLGLIYLELGQPEKALETFEETLRLRLMSPNTFFNMGLALSQLNRIDEATAAYVRAAEMDPTNRHFQGSLGQHYYRTGNHAMALRSLSTAVELGARNLNFMNSLAWILSTSNDASLRDGARALQIVAIIESRIEKQDAAVLRTKAAALAESGRFEEAAAALEVTRDLAGKEGAKGILAHVEIAMPLYRSGKPFRELAAP